MTTNITKADGVEVNRTIETTVTRKGHVVDHNVKGLSQDVSIFRKHVICVIKIEMTSLAFSSKIILNYWITRGPRGYWHPASWSLMSLFFNFHKEKVKKNITTNKYYLI